MIVFFPTLRGVRVRKCSEGPAHLLIANLPKISYLKMAFHRCRPDFTAGIVPFLNEPWPTISLLDLHNIMGSTLATRKVLNLESWNYLEYPEDWDPTLEAGEGVGEGVSCPTPPVAALLHSSIGVGGFCWE